MVKRDRKTIVYVKDFLDKTGGGNVLFNLGVNHIYFDHEGMGKLLQQDERFEAITCSIYPYHRLSDTEKEKFQIEEDKKLPVQLINEMQNAAPYSLVNLSQKGIYPKKYRKAQWIYLIPAAE